MNKRTFTMLEILAVVAIILIVLGILVPTTATVLRRAKVSKTDTAIRNLQIAIKQYEALYGFLPLTGLGVDTKATGLNLTRFYQGLCADPNNVGANPRRVKFLECEYDQSLPDPLPIFLDSWDAPINVSLDLDYDDDLDDGVVNGYVNPGNGDTLMTSIAIWSLGPDGVDSTNDAGSANEDNITSWD